MPRPSSISPQWRLRIPPPSTCIAAVSAARKTQSADSARSTLQRALSRSRNRDRTASSYRSGSRHSRRPKQKHMQHVRTPTQLPTYQFKYNAENTVTLDRKCPIYTSWARIFGLQSRSHAMVLGPFWVMRGLNHTSRALEIADRNLRRLLAGTAACRFYPPGASCPIGQQARQD